MLVTLSSSTAKAADEHLLDPTLSLTGSGTAVSADDQVVDPGAAHPPTRFEVPCGTATDSHGYIYVSSPTLQFGTIVATRLDVFNPQGEFLVRTEVADLAACGAAVDSEGNVYTGGIEGAKIDLFEPSSYPPTASTTYAVTALIENVFATLGCPSGALAVDPSNDHFYLGGACRILEYGSFAEGSPQLGEFKIPSGEVSGGTPLLSGFDVYAENQDIYAALKMQTPGGSGLPDRIYVFDGTDGHVKCEILGIGEPGDLEIGSGAAVAADQENGDLYLYDVSEEEGAVYQFAVEGEDECGLIGVFPQPPVLKGFDPLGDIAVDAPMEAGEASYDSPNQGYVYATAGKTAATSHLWAFGPKIGGPPEIQGQETAEIGETEAVLKAALQPNALDTAYHFEYTTQADFEANGYAKAISVPDADADAGAGGAFVAVSEPIGGLEAGVAYRFRLVATNCEDPEAEPGNCLTVGEGEPGGEGQDASFSTYPTQASQTCPNEALRSGPSASLPDCRSYELVTPPSTGGYIPKISLLGHGYGEVGFSTTPASPDGGSVVFGSNNGALPGLGGGGFFDVYRAQRNLTDGWKSSFSGLTAAQAARPRPGGISPDHLYSFWNVEEPFNTGTLVDPGDYAQYLRVPPGIEPSPNCAVDAEPEGAVEWIGCGSLGHDPEAAGNWISNGGEHVIFSTGYGSGGVNHAPAVKLEPCAPPSGVRAIYDRTPGGPTQCVSVPPSGASAGVQEQFETQNAAYNGISADGSTVVFKVAGTLYARLDNAETVVVEDGGTFAGISDDGDRVFYLRGATGIGVPRGELFACDVSAGPCDGPDAAQEPIQVGSGDEAAVVNVSADGSHAYFVSPEQLDGEAGEEGGENLYAWDGGAVSFIGVVEALDVAESLYERGLGHWISEALTLTPHAFNGPANAPSRTTPDGTVLVFESRADLTGSGYNNDGHPQIFRYDSEAPGGEALTCLSCNPSGEPARSDASLQIPEGGQPIEANPSPVNAITQIANVTTDGQRVFFQSADRLVARDRDGKLDVYEWQAQGTGGCGREAGCLSLISSPRSAADEYLYAMTPDGSDVFFLSGNTLNYEDPDGTPSIYDARIEGGFAPPPRLPAECLGEACQPAAATPDDPTPASSSFEGSGNVVEPPPSCGASARKAKRLTRRAQRVRHAAARAHDPRQARRMRRKAARQSGKAQRLAKQTSRCRRANRRAAP